MTYEFWRLTKPCSNISKFKLATPIYVKVHSKVRVLVVVVHVEDHHSNGK